jgi:glycosyltransferase involved in cell wall biosynthesis
LKIVHIIVGLGVGGAELALKRLVEAHKDSPNYCHYVISLTSTGDVGMQLQALGVEVQALGMRRALDMPFILWNLTRMLRTMQPTIVQTWMYHADLLGGLAARMAGIRCVVWGIRTTNVDASGSRATAIVRLVCASLSHYVPHTIVCVAQAARKSHLAIGYDASRMVVIPNGFDLLRLHATAEQRQALRNHCHFKNGALVIGFLGRFHPDKGQHNFVQAAVLLAKKNENVRFLMVGRDLDASNLQLNRWISDTGYKSRFVFLGERADVPICLAAMDVFCLSSQTEAFPNVVAEAMAMGLPCVVTDVGDAAMLVADTGIVVPKENPEGLAIGMGQLLAMPYEARQLLGQKAKSRIQTVFSMTRCTERYEAVYQNVIAGKQI